MSVNDEQARCVHCGEVYDKAEQEKQRRDRCPACKRGHPADSYERLCGSEWCRCLS